MKWVTLILLLFVVSFTQSKILPRQSRDAEHQSDIGERFKQLTEENFEAVAMVIFSQAVQQATYEEIAKLVQDVSELGKKCSTSQEDPTCLKSLDTIFLDEICHEEGFAAKYDLAACCAKAEVERKECLLAHKNATPGFIPAFQRPGIEVSCKLYQDDRLTLLGNYIYEVARRHPYLQVPPVFATASLYDEALKTCCQTADKATCFHPRIPPLIEYLKMSNGIQENTCGILKKFGERTLKATKLVQMSQKFPKADFATINKLVEDITHMHTECCRGDTLECLRDREALTEYTCSHKDAISSKLPTCCEKSVLERGECIVRLENDDKPADLSERIAEYIEDPHVCDHLAKEQDAFLAKFLYEYSRRHPELSTQILLGVGKGYQELLERCCKTDNPPECYGQAEADLKKHIAQFQELVQQNCDLYNTLGGYLFHNALLIRYTKRMPQLTSEELIFYTKGLTKAASRCCEVSVDKKLPCTEGYVDFVLGQICQRHQRSSINVNVCQCCSNSYALRSLCITSLGGDEKFVPIEFSADLFTFHEDLCHAAQDKLQERKQQMIVNLVKHKPNITKEQLQTVFGGFTKMTEKCCKAEDHEACFGEEGPKLVAESQTALAA